MKTMQTRIAVCTFLVGALLIGACVVGLADWVYVVRCISEENPNMETSINIMNPTSSPVEFTYRFAWQLKSGSVVACGADAWLSHLGEIKPNETFNLSNTVLTDGYIWHSLGDRDPLPHEVWNGDRLDGVAFIRTRTPLVSVGVVYCSKGVGGLAGSIDVEHITPIEVVDFVVPWSGSGSASQYTTQIACSRVSASTGGSAWGGGGTVSVVGGPRAVDGGSLVAIAVPGQQVQSILANANGSFQFTTYTGPGAVLLVRVGVLDAAGNFVNRCTVRTY